MKGEAFTDLEEGMVVYGAASLYKAYSSILVTRKSTVAIQPHVMDFNLSFTLPNAPPELKRGSGVAKLQRYAIGLKATRNNDKSWNDGSVIIPERDVVIGAPEDPLDMFSTDPVHRITRWSFIVLKGAQNTFGIVTDDFDVDTDGYINKTERGWGLYQDDGRLGHGGVSNIEYAEAFKTEGNLVDGLD